MLRVWYYRIGVLILREEKLVIFLPGLVGKGLDSTILAVVHPARMAFICRWAAWRVIDQFIIVRDHIVIIVNSKLVSMHVIYYIWGVIVIVVIIFVTRTVCV